MPRKIEVMLGLVASGLLVLACAVTGQVDSRQQPEPAVEWQATITALENQLQKVEEESQVTVPDVIGFWVSESDESFRNAQLFAVTGENVYRLQTFDPQSINPEPSVQETFSQIVDHDEAKGQMTLRTQWVRVNGEFVGFDYPEALMTYRVSDGALRFAISRLGDGKFPEEVGSIEYYRR